MLASTNFFTRGHLRALAYYIHFVTLEGATASFVKLIVFAGLLLREPSLD